MTFGRFEMEATSALFEMRDDEVTRWLLEHGIPMATKVFSPLGTPSCDGEVTVKTADLTLQQRHDVAMMCATGQKLQADELATTLIFEENKHSVVCITKLALRQDAFTHDVVKVPQGFGSGIVWNRSGHIVTNFHVICDASDLSVELADGSVYEARVSGFDRDMDVAVLYMQAPKELRPIHVGVSADLLVGQKVYAIGNPFNLKHTLTTGVISGLHRAIRLHATGRPIQDVIQTDAAINPGNSGGPLLDSSGKLIGVNTALCSPSGVSSGVGFSIPIDTVGGIVNQLIKSDEVTRLGELHL